MNWEKVFQIIWNTAVQFGLTYLAARGAGANNTAALGTGATAVLTGQAALAQKPK